MKRQKKKSNLPQEPTFEDSLNALLKQHKTQKILLDKIHVKLETGFAPDDDQLHRLAAIVKNFHFPIITLKSIAVEMHDDNEIARKQLLDLEVIEWVHESKP